MDGIYQEVILDHYKNPRHFGVLNKKNAAVDLYNPLCGDSIHLELFIEKGKVKDVRFRGQGCVLSQASASLLTEYVTGKSPQTLLKLTSQFMLKLTGVTVGPTRLKCILLSFEAMKKALLIKHHDKNSGSK